MWCCAKKEIRKEGPWGKERQRQTKSVYACTHVYVDTEKRYRSIGRQKEWKERRKRRKGRRTATYRMMQ
jgi:hypothetical protein